VEEIEREVLDAKPTPIIRLTTPILTTGTTRDGVLRGAYIVRDFGVFPDAIIMATGSELQLAVDAAKVGGYVWVGVAVGVGVGYCVKFEQWIWSSVSSGNCKTLTVWILSFDGLEVICFFQG